MTKFKAQPPPEQLFERGWVEELHDALAAQTEEAKRLFSKKETEEWIYLYKTSLFNDINKYLRKSRGEILSDEEPLREFDERMQRFMGLHRWQYDDVHLYRALHGAHAAHVTKLAVGQSFVNKGYSSTAFDPRHSLDFGKVVLIIKPAPGMHFLYIDALREQFCGKRRNKDERWVFQSEVVLDKGTEFKVTKRGRGSISSMSDRTLYRHQGCDARVETMDYELVYVDAAPAKKKN